MKWIIGFFLAAGIFLLSGGYALAGTYVRTPSGSPVSNPIEIAYTVTPGDVCEAAWPGGTEIWYYIDEPGETIYEFVPVNPSSFSYAPPFSDGDKIFKYIGWSVDGTNLDCLDTSTYGDAFTVVAGGGDPTFLDTVTAGMTDLFTVLVTGWFLLLDSGFGLLLGLAAVGFLAWGVRYVLKRYGVHFWRF